MSKTKGCGVIALCAVTCSAGASAGELDGEGHYVVDREAVTFVSFGDDFDPTAARYVPADAAAVCLPEGFSVVEAADALDGGSYLHVDTNIVDGCSERFRVALPNAQGSYRARLWMRHGSIDAQLTVAYAADSGLETLAAKLGPTGRVTSDGWVELASNELPVDTAGAEAVYLRVFDVDTVGSDIDALEIVPAGQFWEQRSCDGVSDPVCGIGGLCLHNRCRLGRIFVPPLPHDRLRDDMVDSMEGQLRVLFGGSKTRRQDLPNAIARLEAIRHADDAWTFWNGWATAVRLLHDWHTSASSGLGGIDRRARLNACFIEGDGDASASAWPSHPKYRDVLVSHVGSSGAQGIGQGDRLVAVDGQHPIEWALELVEIEWGFWWADDNDVYSEIVERMRGLVLAYATSFDLIHCDAMAGTCDAAPERYLLADLPDDPQGGNVRCDNRPYYHLETGNPSASHNVGFNFFKGPIQNTGGAVHGLLWDTLYGGGDPNGHVNGNLTTAFAEFKANAKGVILDHRAGSGGTLDGSETATHLMRPPETILVFISPMETAGFDGPDTLTEGVGIFDQFSGSAGMHVGSTGWDPDMPIAVLTHRDGSASDFFPFGVKGAPKTLIFGPGPTAGAFSTYYNFRYWAGIGFQMASGDSIAFDGRALIGHGVEPDVVVQQKQSDILGGKDTIHEAALAWVMQNLKP